MAKQATGSAGQILIKLEKNWGVIDENAKTFLLSSSLYGESLSSESSELVSQAINPNRGVSDVRNGQITVSGSVPVEISQNGSDVLFYAMLGDYVQTKEGDKFKKVFKRAKTLPSLTFEKGFTDIDQYFQYLGVKLNALQLSIEPDGLITGSIDVLGKEEQNTQVSISSDLIEVDHSAFAGLDGNIKEDNKDACYTSMNVNITNGLYDSRCIGNNKSSNIGEGLAEVTGDVTMMFTDVVMYKKWLNEIETNIKLTFEYKDSSIEFLFPRIRFNGNASPLIESAEGVTQTFNFRSLSDKTLKSDIVITTINDFDLDLLVKGVADDGGF